MFKNTCDNLSPKVIFRRKKAGQSGNRAIQIRLENGRQNRDDGGGSYVSPFSTYCASYFHPQIGLNRIFS